MTLPATTTEHGPLACALRYAGCGLRVLPIPPGKKHPPMPAWQDAATTDPATIEAWWGGLYAGHGCGLAPDRLPDGSWWFAVDIDQHGADGHAVWADLCDGHGGAPQTAEATTGGGGTHLLFTAPHEVRNGRLADGIDIRGHGGQIVAEPSVHPSGQPYQWVEGQEPWSHPIAPAPGWLLAMLDREEPTPTAGPRMSAADAGTRPGDLWAAETTWDDLLGRDGWQRVRDGQGGEARWVRPGKDKREGISATVGYKGSDVLKVFTSSVPELRDGETYTKLGYLAATRFGGDHSAAASALASDGFRAAPSSVPPPTDDGWPTPAPLPRAPEPPPFPIEALPAWAQAHAIAAAEQVQVPADLTAMLIIGGLSAAATGRADARISPVWTEPINLFLVTAMKSGAGKSPAEKLCCSWLHRWERERIEAAMPEWEKANQSLRLAQKKVESAERIGDEAEAAKALVERNEKRDAMPTIPRLLADDATPEAVAGLLRSHGERLAILSTEADLFDLVLRGKTGQRANLNIYLKSWSGDPHKRDRKGGSESGPEWAPLVRPLMTISVTVQPEVLRRLMADDEMASRGFAARFMFAVPPQRVGWRDHGARFRADGLPTLAPYEEACTRLASRWASWQMPATLRFSDAGAGLLLDLLTELEPMMAPEGDLDDHAEFVAKMVGSVARYAGLLHIAEDGETMAEVAPETVARAVTLGRYWLAHAVAAAGPVDVEHVPQAEALLLWLSDDGRRTVTLAEMQAKVRRPGIGLDRVADYVPAVELLCDLGWLTPTTEGDWREQVGVRRSASPEFRVAPMVAGSPRSAFYPRSPRTACMGERDSPLPPSDTATPRGPRGTRIARITQEIDASPDDHAASPPEPTSPPHAELDPDGAWLFGAGPTDDTTGGPA